MLPISFRHFIKPSIYVFLWCLEISALKQILQNSFKPKSLLNMKINIFLIIYIQIFLLLVLMKMQMCAYKILLSFNLEGFNSFLN